jgi:hypothetical protein
VMKMYKVKGEGRQSQLSFMTLLHIFNVQHVSAQVKKAMIRQN